LHEIKGLPPKAVEKIRSFPVSQFLQDELKLMRQQDVQFLTFQDTEYPQRLKTIPDAPVVLYIKGQKLSNDDVSIAMVGSRQASVYGQNTAEQLSLSLAERGLTVISGLARGIDTAVHRGALKAKGRTIAVLGSGLADIYPASNKRLAEQIIKDGTLVSEFAMTMPPISYNFPRRNRIVSGLSLGVVVVEAALKSGALITCDFALEQGREVFAVPGPINHPNSNGVHQLIKQGAKLVGHVDDILDELKLEIRQTLILGEQTQTSKKDVDSGSTLTEAERSILKELLRGPAHIDGLAFAFQKSPAEMTGLLLKLELKGVVRQLPGKMFMRSNKEEAVLR
jgi:DNA processing protein